MSSLANGREAMTPEQRKLYDETVAKNKAFNEVMAAVRARNRLALQKLQDEHDKAVEQYIKGQEKHISHSLKTNDKLGNINLGERKCPVCGKTIFIQDKTAWLFKLRYGKGFIYLCSESCKETKAKQKRRRSKQ